MLYAAAILGTAFLGWGLIELLGEDDDSAPETVVEEQEYDTVTKGDAEDNDLTGSTGNDLLIGKGGDDTLTGGDGNDDLRGWAGFDTLFGGDGMDTLDGGSADDSLRGGDGDDLLIGGTGDDHLEGGAQNDQMAGGDGTDTLFGERGDDSLLGNAGDDSLIGGNGADALAGGSGEDVLLGGDGNDVLLGTDPFAHELTFDDLAQISPDASALAGLSADVSEDTSGADTLYGEAGDDWLVFGAGDQVWGGDGEDLFTLFNDQTDGSAPASIVDFNNGSDAEQIAVIYKGGTTPPAVTAEKIGDDTHVSLDGVKALIVEDEDVSTVLAAVVLVESA